MSAITAMTSPTPISRPVPPWVRLQLDIDSFDDGEFEPYLYACQDIDIDFTSMAEFGDTSACRRALYELNKTCAADIPERGEFYTYEDYLAERIATQAYDPRGVILAVSKREWVGMAATSLNNEGAYAFSEMTGVLPGNRGKGISVAMKLLAVRFVRTRGVPVAADMPPPRQRKRHRYEPPLGVRR